MDGEPCAYAYRSFVVVERPLIGPEDVLDATPEPFAGKRIKFVLRRRLTPGATDRLTVATQVRVDRPAVLAIDDEVVSNFVIESDGTRFPERIVVPVDIPPGADRERAEALARSIRSALGR